MSAPVGVWLISGTPLEAPRRWYPCRCRPGRECSAVFCACAGRMDVWNFAPGCCAWVVTPAVAARAAAEHEAQRAMRAAR